VIKEVRERGVNIQSICWRKLNGEYITGMSGMDATDYPDTYVCYPVHLLTALLLEELHKFPSVTVHWRRTVVDVGQDDSKAWVDIEGLDGPEKLSADFVVGCDGARSSVRKALFGRNFPGHTWDKQIVATNVLPLNLVCDCLFG
jgi:2-polyprenyl-6-methoxyphenol hydroxylase-like FAD-dependent oxidoreductase